MINIIESKPYLFSKEDTLFSLDKVFKISKDVNHLSNSDLLSDFSVYSLLQKIRNFLNITNFTPEILHNFGLNINHIEAQKIQEVISKVQNLKDYIIKYTFRPYDQRYAFIYPYSNLESQSVTNCSDKNCPNIIVTKVDSNTEFFIFLSSSKTDSDINCINPNHRSYSFPILYISETKEVTDNFNPEIVSIFSEKLGLQYLAEDYNPLKDKFFTRKELFYYIYAVLNSKNFSKRFNSNLEKFPNIPIISDVRTFHGLVEIGSMLCKVHLLEENVFLRTNFWVLGENKIEFIKYIEQDEEIGRVQINSNQYFGDVPKRAWSYKIGSYSVLPGWLDYRMGKKLDRNEVIVFQKIVESILHSVYLKSELDKIFHKD